MDYILVGLLVLLLLVIFNLIGKIMTLRFNISVRFNIPLGYVFSLAICQIVGVLAVLLHVSTDIFTLMYLVTMVIILSVWILQISKNQRLSSELFCVDNMFALRSKKQLYSVTLLLVGALIIYLNVMTDYSLDRMSDSAFYIPHILENVNADHIYSINPWSGAEEPFNSLYVYVTYELFHAMILNIFSVNGLLYINHGMTVMTFIMSILCISELALKLFKPKKAFLSVLFWLFITTVFINNIRDHYFFFFSTDVIQRVPYTGKVLAYFALIPMMYTFFIDFLRSKINRNNIVQLLVILNLAMMALTSTIFFLSGIYYAGVLFFLLWSKQKRYDDVLLLILSTWPLILFVILAKFPILTVPIIIIYLCLYGLYCKKVQIIYPFIKYGLFLISILIPISSLVLQIISFRTELEVFNIQNFLSRFVEPFGSFSTVIVWFMAILGAVMSVKSQKTDEIHKLLFVKVSLYILLVFINPISCLFVATFMTSQAVYHRLFYILPIFPLLSFFIVILVEKLASMQSKRAIYTAAISGIASLVIYQCYTEVDTIVSNRLLDHKYSYKTMITSDYYDTGRMLGEELTEKAKVAMYVTDSHWATELRSLRSFAPNAVLPYNTYTHRRLTENGEYSKDDYYNYQIMLLLSATMSVYDLFIDENGVLTDITNGEALIDYLFDNYDYVVFPKGRDNKALLKELYKRGVKIVNSTNRDYLIKL